MDEPQVALYRSTIRRKLFRLKLRFRLLFFMESALLGLTAVFLLATVVSIAGKVIFLPSVLRSTRTLIAATEAVGVLSLVWASVRPVQDQELASFIDHEIRQPGRVESAVDFLNRSEEIDPLFFRPFMEGTAGILSSTPDSQIVGLRVPLLWRPAALALALLLIVHLFIPVARLVDEKQDPFLIEDMHRLSRELENALFYASRQEENLTREDRELFEKAEELARRMDATAVDPSYLQDELLRLSRGINERSAQAKSVNDRLLAQLLDEIERLRQEQESIASQSSELTRALDALSYSAREMQEATMEQRARSAEELTEALQGLLNMDDGQLSQAQTERIQRMISEMQSQLQHSSNLRRVSEVAQESLRSLDRSSLQELISRNRNQLSQQSRQWLQSQRSSQQDGTPSDIDAPGGVGFMQGSTDGDGYAQGASGDSGAESEAGMDGLGARTSGDGSGMEGMPADGIGSGVGRELFGGQSDPVEGYRTYLDHSSSLEGGEEMDLTLSTVLGAPSSGEVQMHAPDQLEPSFGEAYEGQIPEGEYPERYKQIISNYFDGLK